MSAVFGGKSLIGPNTAPTLAADFFLAMGAGGEIPGIKGEDRVANLAALRIVDKRRIFFSVLYQNTILPRGFEEQRVYMEQKEILSFKF